MSKKILLLIMGSSLLWLAVSCRIYLADVTGLPDASFYEVKPTSPKNPVPIAGKWKLVSVMTPERGKVFPEYPLPVPTLTIYPEGQFEGYSGCNSVHGELTVKGDSIFFGKTLSTAVSCPDNQMEKWVAYAMGAVDTYLAGNRWLYLKHGTEVLLVYKAEVEGKY